MGNEADWKYPHLLVYGQQGTIYQGKCTPTDAFGNKKGMIGSGMETIEGTSFWGIDCGYLDHKLVSGLIS
jgi:hypothetical protein